MPPDRPKTTRELRKFGLTLLAAFGALGALSLWKGGAAAPYLLGVAAAFGLGALLAPSTLRPVEWAWMKFALVLSAVMTRVILAVAFALVITPFGLLLRLMGKDLLALRRDAARASYWEPVEPDGPGTRPDKPF